MKTILRLPYFLTWLFLSCNAVAQQKDDYSTRIDSLIQTTNVRPFNGVIVVAQNGKTKYAKAYGFSNFNTRTPQKTTDRFSTMSIAKQITATLILQEVEKGTIDLHVPIRKYLPELPYSWADTVTMHHLLNHTSGLQSDDRTKPLKFPAGKDFNYSNVGYSLAGQILEKQTHKTFNELVTALFKKCGMHSSAYPTATNRKLLVKGHTVKEDGTVIMNERISFEPAGCFASHLMVTAADLATWNQCLHGGKLLKPATYKLMTGYSITAIHKVFSEQPIGYGYGLRINDKAAISEIGHTGFHPGEGFTAVNLYYPKSNTSVIVLENQAYENFDIAYYFEQQVRAIILSSTLIK